MKHILIISICLLLTACTGLKTPSTSGDPAKMSADTLCFRYASSEDPALGAEIAARNLDCVTILRDDPLYPSGPDLDAAHRMGR